MDIFEVSIYMEGKFLRYIMIIGLFKNVPIRRLVKFIITGGIALAIDMTIYFFLTRYGHLHYLLSRVVSLVVAIVWNFSVNRIWTFRAVSEGVIIQAPRFLVVISATSCLNLFLMHVGVAYLYWNDLIVLLLVSALITIFNFTAHSFWSYAQKNS